jgi:hypothetical protein
MQNEASKEEADALMYLWEAAINRRDFTAAVKAGIDAYLHGERDGEKLEVKAALGRMHVAITMMFEAEQVAEPSHPSCSFCGISGPDVKLGAGPSAYICMSCVSIFHDEAGLKQDK